MPEEIWQRLCAVGRARGILPLVLLDWLVRHALDRLPRIEEEIGR